MVISAKNLKTASDIIERTREGILFQKATIVNGLLGLQYASQLLEQKNIVDWTERELSGYALGDDEFPSYRKGLHCIIISRNDSLDLPKYANLRLGISAPQILDFIEHDKEAIFGPVMDNVKELNEHEKNLTQKMTLA